MKVKVVEKSILGNQILLHESSSCYGSEDHLNYSFVGFIHVWYDKCDKKQK